jgi:hypothetical protein
MTTCNHYIGVEKKRTVCLAAFNTMNENAERHTPFKAQAEVVPCIVCESVRNGRDRSLHIFVFSISRSHQAALFLYFLIFCYSHAAVKVSTII